MTPEERTVLERARVATLATADDGGRPHAVPICFAVLEGTTGAGDGDGDSDDDPEHNPDRGPRIVSAIDEKPKSTRTLRRVRDVRANPQATVLVDYYSEDWSRLAWVQVRGRARVLSPDSDPDRDVGDSAATESVPAVHETYDHDAAVDALESKYDQYADHDLSERPVLEIRVDRTLSWGALEAYAESD